MLSLKILQKLIFFKCCWFGNFASVAVITNNIISSKCAIDNLTSHTTFKSRYPACPWCEHNSAFQEGMHKIKINLNSVITYKNVVYISLLLFLRRYQIKQTTLSFMQCISVVCSWNRSTICRVSLDINKSKRHQQSPSNKVVRWALFMELNLRLKYIKFLYFLYLF